MKKYIPILALSFLVLMLVVTPASATIRKTGSQGDYFPMANFKLEIDGVIQAGFKEISGLESETEIIEYKDDDDITRKRPGQINYSSIVLERGFISNPALLEWYQRVKEGVSERKSGSVIVLDRAGQESMRYNFFGGWPINLEAPGLDTKGDTHTVEEGFRVIEELELAYERIEIVSGENNYFPLTFHFADGDIPALVDIASINVLFDPPGLFSEEEDKKEASPWKHHDIQGLDAPTLEFTSGEPYRLEMELFFDRYEEGKSVREFTDKIEKLALVHQELHRPPTALAGFGCVVTWGDKTYACEIEKTETRFTLFLDDGTPVRAVMNIVFKEFSPAEDQLKGKPRH